MGAFIPKWRPLDAVNSARLLSARPDEGGVAALCVSPSLAGTTEAATLAIDLTGSWATAGLRVLLADGTVGTPSLHIPFGLPNDGGLADVLLAGSGWEGLTLPTGTPGLRLLPAGGGSGSTAPQDALKQLAKLCADTSAEGTLLVFFVPLGSMVTEWVFSECTDIVVLSTEGENLQPFFEPDEDRVRALLGRPAERMATAAPTAPAVDAAPQEASAPAEAEASQPPRAKRAPAPADAEPSGAASRSDRRPVSTSGGPPPTARIEEAWAKAAAQLRATLEANPKAMDDLFSNPPQRTPAEAPSDRTPPPPASDPAPAPEVGAEPVSPPEAEPPAAPPPTAEATPPATEPAAEAPPPTEPVAVPAPPKPRPRAKAPAEATPLPLFEEPRDAFPEPELPPPLPLLESWDPELGADEAQDRARAARWRKRGRNALLALAGVAVVAVVVVVRNAGRAMPPFEAPVAPFPGAVAESEDPPEVGASEELPGDVADPAAEAAAEAGDEPGEATPAPVERPSATPTAAAAAVAPGAPHQRFSWSIAALGTFRAARSLSQRLSRSVPDQAFMVAPIVSNGRTLYRVLGGLSEDRPGLVAQRASLGERTRLNASEWFVREAPSAFLLDEFDDRADAQARTEELWGAGVPVYVLVVDRTDGSEGHRVYAGAYASEEEGAPLLALLREAGITDWTFTERRGRVAR